MLPPTRSFAVNGLHLSDRWAGYKKSIIGHACVVDDFCDRDLVGVTPYRADVLVFFALWSGHYVNVSVTCFVLELNGSVNESIEGVVLAHANVSTWTVNSTALTADDVTGFCELPTKKFHSESLAV